MTPTQYYCCECLDDLTDDEALHVTLPEHIDHYHGDTPRVIDIVDACPHCGSTGCVKEKEE